MLYHAIRPCVFQAVTVDYISFPANGCTST